MTRSAKTVVWQGGPSMSSVFEIRRIETIFPVFRKSPQSAGDLYFGYCALGGIWKLSTVFA